MAEKIWGVQFEVIKKKLDETKAKYKVVADKHQNFKIFKDGD